ncbi:MAG: PEGA domain-containing protein [Gemmatimonadota bacterium]|nr:MAG: PEGA domain-containing protein [Gemmatimonadota bacterium]
MTHKASYGSLTLITALVVTGCASIVSGTTQDMTVTSNVEDAEIFLDGVRIGTTPFTGLVKKNKGQLRVEQEGYETGTLTLSKSLDPWFWGNIIIGGTVGSITDFATGAAFTYAPASYRVELQAEGQSANDFQQQVRLRWFSMIYIDEISRDISQGGGDYLSALVTLLEEHGGEEIDPVAISDALATSGGDPNRFGDCLTELF